MSHESLVEVYDCAILYLSTKQCAANEGYCQPPLHELYKCVGVVGASEVLV